MKQIIFSSLFLLSLISKAQIYFNKSIPFDTAQLSNGYTNMIVDDNKIYCLGGNLGPNLRGHYLDKFDENANLITRNSYIEANTYIYHGGLGNNFMKFGTNYFATGYSKKGTNYYNGLVFKFNIDGDTVWVKKKFKVNSVGTTFRHSIKTSESEFVTLGDVAYYNSALNFNFGQVYLVKFDTLSNIVWEHELGYTGNISEFVYGIYPANDGGFFIYGSKVNYQAYSDFYLLKVDSMGNFLWQRSWGNLYYDIILGFYELPNGNLIVSGQISDDYFGTEVYQAYLAMLTPDGNQRIWEKRYFWYTNTYALYQIFHNINETYDIWGYESNTDQGVDITRPFLMHFSSNFDSLDTKYYSYWNGPGAQNYIRDIVKMPDQGYVACGFGWDNANDEDGWLLRIDSNGCANVNCTPLAIQESTNDIINELAIYPNPATDKIYIKTKSAEVIKSIRLFDIRGTANKAQFTGNEIDVSMLANGLYIIEITNAQGNIQRFKALKE